MAMSDAGRPVGRLSVVPPSVGGADRHPGRALPAYSGKNPVCAKCGAAGAHTQYYAAGEHSHSGMADRDDLPDCPERQERICDNCGYIWSEATVQDSAARPA